MSARSSSPLGSACAPPSAYGRTCAASSAGSECSPEGGAGAVGAGDGDAEGALAEARLHGLRRAVAAQLVGERLGLLPEPRRALQALGEDALPVAARDVDGLAALDARVPVGVVGDPLVAAEEHRLRDHDAADLVVLGTSEDGAPRAAADRLDARRHLGEGVGAVQVAMGQDFDSVDECPERSGAVDPALQIRAHLDQRLAQVLVVELAIVVKAPDNDAGVAPDGLREGVTASSGNRERRSAKNARYGRAGTSRSDAQRSACLSRGFAEGAMSPVSSMNEPSCPRTRWASSCISVNQKLSRRSSRSVSATTGNSLARSAAPSA